MRDPGEAGLQTMVSVLTDPVTETRTAEDGTYSFASIPGGPQTVSVAIPDGYVTLEGETFFKRVTLEDGGTATVDFALERVTPDTAATFLVTGDPSPFCTPR